MARPDPKTVAAIAAALHLYMEEHVHDKESGVITITHHSSLWNCPAFSFRKTINRK